MHRFRLNGVGRSRVIAHLTLAAVLLGLISAAPALSAVLGTNEPQIGISGEIAPTRLPRSRFAPASVTLGFTSEVPSTHKAPRLNGIALEFGRNIAFARQGLPGCPLKRLLSTYGPSTSACRKSIVGHGTAVAEVELPRTEPQLTRVEGRLQAYFDQVQGRPWVLALITSETLGLDYVLTFELRGSQGFGPSLVIPPPVMHKLPGVYALCNFEPGCYEGSHRFRGIYDRISSFEMSLHRVFAHHGKRESFVSADCPAGNSKQLIGRFESVTLEYAEEPLKRASLPGRCSVAG